MGLHLLGCPVDILGTNCKKLLKLKMGWGQGWGGGGKSPFSFSTCNHVWGAARHLLLDKKKDPLYMYIFVLVCFGNCVLTWCTVSVNVYDSSRGDLDGVANRT